MFLFSQRSSGIARPGTQVSDRLRAPISKTPALFFKPRGGLRGTSPQRQPLTAQLHALSANTRSQQAAKRAWILLFFSRCSGLPGVPTFLVQGKPLAITEKAGRKAGLREENLQAQRYGFPVQSRCTVVRYITPRVLWIGQIKGTLQNTAVLTQVNFQRATCFSISVRSRGDPPEKLWRLFNSSFFSDVWHSLLHSEQAEVGPSTEVLMSHKIVERNAWWFFSR